MANIIKTRQRKSLPAIVKRIISKLEDTERTNLVGNVNTKIFTVNDSVGITINEEFTTGTHLADSNTYTLSVNEYGICMGKFTVMDVLESENAMWITPETSISVPIYVGDYLTFIKNGINYGSDILEISNGKIKVYWGSAEYSDMNGKYFIIPNGVRTFSKVDYLKIEDMSDKITYGGIVSTSVGNHTPVHNSPDNNLVTVVTNDDLIKSGTGKIYPRVRDLTYYNTDNETTSLAFISQSIVYDFQYDNTGDVKYVHLAQYITDYDGSPINYTGGL